MPHYSSAPGPDFVGIGTVLPACALDVVIPSNSGQVHAARWGAPATPYGMLTEDPAGYFSGALSLCQNGTPSTFISANGPSYLMGGSVGIGTKAPRSILSIITANPSTPATATQFTIGEATNNSRLSAWRSAITTTLSRAVTKGYFRCSLVESPAPFTEPQRRQRGYRQSSARLRARRDWRRKFTGAFRVNGTALAGGGVTDRAVPAAGPWYDLHQFTRLPCI